MFVPLKPLKIGAVEIPVPTYMAPMCGISDSPWRKVLRRFRLGLVSTEMTSSEALIREKEQSYKLMGFSRDEEPVVVQFCGSEPAVLAHAAEVAEARGAAIVDLNMGCPVKKITAQGAGSALLLDLPRVGRIFAAMVGAVKIPVTIKIRSGWDERQMVAREIARLAENEGIAAIAVHARTRAQAFEGQADWRIIAELVESTRLPVIGNGDLEEPEDVYRMLSETGCAGFMIGRGAQGRPWIFEEIVNPDFAVSPQYRYEVIRQHFEEACTYYGESRGVLMMRKHLAWYSKKLRNGTHFRDRIMKLHAARDVLGEIEQFFGEDVISGDAFTPQKADGSFI